MIGRILQLGNVNTALVKPDEIVRRLSDSADISPLDIEYEAIWRQWFTNRKLPDHIITNSKCSGALIGLIIMQSCLAEGRGPVYYIVPRPHMISSIIQRAQLLGLKAINAEDRSIKQDFSKIQVLSVRHAFRNIAGTGSVFVDAAEECAAEAINMFSLNIPSYSSLYSELAGLLCNKPQAAGDQGCIVSGIKWQAKSAQIRLILQEYKEFDTLFERIQLLEDMLENCSCSITDHSILIAPEKINSDNTGIIASSRHRVFMISEHSQIKLLESAFGVYKEQQI